jgi:hypothetical protein
MKPLRPSRLKRWLQRATFAIVALITLTALALAIEGYRAKLAWEALEREHAARGESLEWSAQVAPPVPDDQNLLATPVLAACFGFAADSPAPGVVAPGPEACAALRRMSDWIMPLLPGPGNWRDAKVVPITDWQQTLREEPSAPSPGVDPAFLERYGLPSDPELMEAMRQRREGAPTPPAANTARATPTDPRVALAQQPPGTAVEDLQFLLGRHQAEMDEIRAAAQRPVSRLSSDSNLLIESLMPQFGTLRSLARLFTVSSWVELTADNPQLAATDIETALALSDAAVSQPLLIGFLVRLAMVEVAIQPVWAGLAERRWPETELARLEARLAQVNSVAELERCLQGERAFGLASLIAVSARRGPEPSLASEEFMPLYRALRWWPRAFLYRNQINLARAYQEVLLEPLDPAGPSVTVATYTEAHSSRYGSPRPYNFFAATLLPALDKAGEQAAASQVTISLARVAIALERHRQAHGEYPETLEDLLPRFLETLPPDPVNGGPLHYRRDTPDRFTLYSIGLNQQDDGGVPSVPRHGSFGPRAPSGDWVWFSHARE